MNMIQPAVVKRDSSGAWTHPGMPLFDEGDADKYHAWVEQQGLEVRFDSLESDDEAGEAHAECAENGHFTTWNPAPPKGDGWFMLAIDDTDDGPTVWWARRTQGA